MDFETIATLTDETFLIVAAGSGQFVSFGGVEHPASDGESVRVYGTGPVGLSAGSKWSRRALFAGNYTGPYFDGDTLSTVPAESLTLQRSIDGSPWVTLAEDLALDDAVTDPLPHLTHVNRYRAISKTALPTEAIGKETEFQLNPDAWISTPVYLSGGPGFGQVCHVIGHSSDDNPVVGEAHHQFVGDEYPTAFFDTHSEQTVTFGGPLILDSSRPTEWHALLQQRNTVCLRDRIGNRIFGTMRITLPTTNGVTHVQGSVFRTEFREEEYWLSQEPA